MQVSFWCSINGEFVSGILNFGRICSNIDDGRFDALKCRKRIRNSMFGYNYSPIMVAGSMRFEISKWRLTMVSYLCNIWGRKNLARRAGACELTWEARNKVSGDIWIRDCCWNSAALFTKMQTSQSKKWQLFWYLIIRYLYLFDINSNISFAINR